MKVTTKYLLFFASLFAATQTICAENKLVRITVGGTELCLPEAYSPNTTAFENFLAPVKEELDSSGDSELIYIPASKIKEAVPSYVTHRRNKYNVNVELEINGIAYASNSIDTKYLQQKAWDMYRENGNALVIKDEETGYFKLFEFGRPSFMWSLATTPPPKDGAGNPPEGWYIGHCAEIVDGWDCSQHVLVDSILYDYKIDMANFQRRTEVASAIINLISQWRKSCQS